jgi:S-DNA-T family DNA segregation ATPase FtsK/SpoIIIE
MAKPTPKKPAEKPDPRARAGQKSPAPRADSAKSKSAAKPGHSAPIFRLPVSTKKNQPVSRRAPAPPVSRAKTQSKPLPLSGGLSLDRKLDIAGIILALAGLSIVLSLVSATRSTIMGGLIDGIIQVFGWGAYLLPITLIVLGLWLVLRNFQYIPTLSLERLLGLLLLYGNLLAAFHFIRLPADWAASSKIAAAGSGGGFLGALFLEGLRATLGLGGAAIALLAWFLIALALSLDVSVLDLFSWMPPLVTRFEDYLQDAVDDLRSIWAPKTQNLAVPEYAPGTLHENLDADLIPITGNQPVAGVYQGMPPEPGMAPRAWVLPNVADILDEGGEVNYDDDYDRQRARTIEETLASFGAPAKVIEISRGPTITQFGVEPDFIESRGGRMRVRVGKIAALADDLALALSARTIRIQAPVPGKGFVGIEVPNDEIALVALRDVIESEAFKRLKSPLRFALGQDVAGNAVAADLSAMPHLLVAGATGSGKSVCVNSIISSLLLHNTPDDLRLIMVDPKRVELTGYNGIPHLLAPVVVDLERVVSALQWVTREMDQRYHKLAQLGCRNIKDYNAKVLARGEKKLPYLVVIIDELADLMMLAPDDTERTITRLAQLARATGIHLMIATQRPSVDVVTGLIKANFPARVAFAVASGVDSRVILDQPGAERLLGRGDMLFQAPDAPAPARLQGTFVSDNEIQRLVSYWQMFTGTISPAPTATGGVVDGLPQGIPLKQIPLWDEMEKEENIDPLYNEAIDLARRQGRASISMLQRRLRIGYTRAARLVETMESKGIVGPPDPGTGTREILDYGQAAPPVEEQRE